jgi:hypothetical protein
MVAVFNKSMMLYREKSIARCPACAVWTVYTFMREDICMCVCVHTFLCMCGYTFTHAYRLCMCGYTFTHAYRHMHVCVCVHTFLYMCGYTCTHACVCVRARARARARLGPMIALRSASDVNADVV